MKMQFIKTVIDLMRVDDRIVVLLGDIGVAAFQEAFEQFPGRTFNIGICEQAMTSLAAGLAKEGLIPVIYSIAPFIVERSYEQLKVDFGHQKLGGNIASVGASYDYASLGCTHHCPGDVAILRMIPGMQIVTPGNAKEVDVLFREVYANNQPTYYRLTKSIHKEDINVEFGRAIKIKHGNYGTVLSVGSNLSMVLEATQDLDITILYYSTLMPFDAQILLDNHNGAVAIIEPFYEGTLAADVLSALGGETARIISIGVPRQFITNYGRASEHDQEFGLTPQQLKIQLTEFFESD